LESVKLTKLPLRVAKSRIIGVRSMTHLLGGIEMFVRQGAALAVLLASTAVTAVHAQTIQTLRNQMPEIPIYGFLLTDGTAMVRGSNQTLTLNGKTYGDPRGSLGHW
jgi:hypothetical protein